MRLVLTVFSILCFLTAPSWAYYVESGDVYDDQGGEVNLYGVSWFGFETGNHVVHGLWTRNWKDMIAQIKELGFTAVRLPFCPATLDNIDTTSINYSLNPELQGLGSLDILDRVVTELDRQGLYILIDNHNYDCQSINELWYSDSYSEEDWIGDIVFVAERYRGVDRFIGIDIKNEPHGLATWGTGEVSTDWNLAAEKAAGEILSVNPDILIFVQGIQDNPVCSGSLSHWWGGNLEPFDCFPLDIPGDKLVLSPHVYGPDVYVQPYFNDASFPDNMPAIWDTHFGYLADRGYAVIIGEFGGKYGHGGDPRDKVLQDALIDYMDAEGMTDFFYWSWNPNSGDTGGILQDDWQNVWEDKVALLKRLMDGSQPEPTPTPPPVYACSDGVDNDGDGYTDYPSDPGCDSAEDNDELDTQPGGGLTTDVVMSDDWGTGYCAQVTVTNNGSSPVDWIVTISVDGTINDLWNGLYIQNGDSVTVEGESWNNIVQGGGSVDFGFCADRSSPAPTPTPTQPPVYACSDGVDNDGDGYTDYPSDPGCDGAEDGDEFNPEPADGEITTDVVINDDWGTGYCARVFVVNSGSEGVDWLVSFTIEGTVRNMWNAVYEQDGDTVTAEGVSWNNIVQGGGSVDFGFCADR